MYCTIRRRPLSVQAENSTLYHILSSSGYNGSLVTWTVLCLAAAKFKPLVSSMSSFTSSDIANIFILIFIFMILYDFCLLLGYTWRSIHSKPIYMDRQWTVTWPIACSSICSALHSCRIITVSLVLSIENIVGRCLSATVHVGKT
jgi:hypothetical protein